jgi:hypothetical protein
MRMLFGAARGAWLLAPSWLQASMERGEWAPEEEHELADAAFGGLHGRASRVAHAQLKGDAAARAGALSGERVAIMVGVPAAEGGGSTGMPDRADEDDDDDDAMVVPDRVCMEQLVIAAGGEVCRYRDETATACVICADERRGGKAHVRGDWHPKPELASSAVQRQLVLLPASWVFDSITSGGYDIRKEPYAFKL